jgi:hypothetical protein
VLHTSTRAQLTQRVKNLLEPRRHQRLDSPPIGYGGNEDVVLFMKRAGALVRVCSVIGAHFVPLFGRHGFAQ